MNILIVADQFIKGGLETHIDTFYEELKKDNNVFFAFARYEKSEYLNNSLIFTTGLKFNSNPSIEDFCKDVKRLVEIIKENKIDIIHVHPFYCLFPALFAANITNTKIVYTCHGFASINFFSQINELILYKFALEEFLNKAYCVSINGYNRLLPYCQDKVKYFPNLIDITKYTAHNIKNNRKWALISRLDDGKIIEIVKLLEMMPQLKIRHIDIFGEGNQKEYLKNYIKKNNLSNIVTLKGYATNLSQELNNKYNGLIGQGRVAIESLTMNYPTILIGYGKIGGLIDNKKLEKIKNINFIPTTLVDTTLEDLNQELENLYKKHLEESYRSYQLRKEMIDNFSTSKIKEYINDLKKITFSKNQGLEDCYNNIKKLPNRKELFYTSYEVFKILSNYLGTYCSDIELKAHINNHQEIFLLKNRISNLEKNNEELKEAINYLNIKYNNLANEKNILNKKLENILEKDNNINNRIYKLENTGLYSLVKRSIKNIFKKILKR